MNSMFVLNSHHDIRSHKLKRTISISYRTTAGG